MILRREDCCLNFFLSGDVDGDIPWIVPIPESYGWTHYIILQMTTNWKKVFVMCTEIEAGNFTTLVYSILINVGKSVLKMMQTLWKNSLITVKDLHINHVSFIVIAITFSDKKLKALLLYHL
jgi:hypothetical protein